MQFYFGLLKQDLCWKILVVSHCTNFKQTLNSAIWENSWLKLMKSSISISSNFNLILVQHLRPCKARRVSKTAWSGNGKVLESATFEVCKLWGRQNGWRMKCQQTYRGKRSGGKCKEDQSLSKIHRSVLRKIIKDVLYFWDIYDVNLWEKNFGRSMAYSCRTNIFVPFHRFKKKQ